MPTTLHDHLAQLVRYAPPGTLVPVDSLAELLRIYQADVAAPSSTGLSLGEVAERFARLRDGVLTTPKEGTVRKWIRVGVHGVRLKAFRAGRNLRVLETDLDAFVTALSNESIRPRGRAHAGRTGPTRLSAVTPEDEVQAYLEHYRLDGGARSGGRTSKVTP